MAHKLGYLLYACTGIFLLLLGLAWSGKAVGPTASTDTRSRTDREQPILALTFDDGPHPVYTPQLLDGLEKRDVKVSFFLMGKNIMGNEAIVKRMHEDGHLIGNHTFDHVQLNKLPKTKPAADHKDFQCHIRDHRPIPRLRPPAFRRMAGRPGLHRHHAPRLLGYRSWIGTQTTRTRWWRKWSARQRTEISSSCTTLPPAPCRPHCGS